MDTQTAKKNVDHLVAEIKASMPKTYQAIVERAGKAGNVAYEWVRRGLRGEAGYFYARERVRVAGKLDRWVVAGCGAGLGTLTHEALEAELRAPDMVDLILVLHDAAVCARACTGGAHGAH